MPGISVTPPEKPAAAHLLAVQQRLAVAASRAAMATGPAVFVRGYRFTSAQSPGWKVLRQRHLIPPGPAGVLRVTRSIIAADAQPDGAVKLDVYETASHQTARGLMVDLLTGFQTLPERMTLHEQSDYAAVVLHEDRARLFARGNLVIVLSRAGPQAAGIGAVAQSIDALLTAAPKGGRTGARNRARGDPAEMLKFVAPAGALHQDDGGNIVLEGEAQAAAELVYQDDDGSWRRR